MGTKRVLYLAISAGLLAFSALPARAITEQQKQQLEQLDQMDHEEFVVRTEKIYACIHARDFACAEKKIAMASKFINNPHDKATLRTAKKDLAAERKFEAEEKAAAANRVHQRQLAEARAAQQDADRRQREQQQMEAEQRDTNILGGLAILSGAAAGYSTRNYAPDQQARVMTSTMDAVYNGNMEGLNSTLGQVGSEREQAQSEKLQQIREQKARDERAIQAKLEREVRETRLRQEREDRAAERTRQEQARQQKIARQQEDIRQKAEAEKIRLAAVEAAKPKWGSIQLEAIAICRQSTKSGKWECNGALDNQTIVDEPTLKSALGRQHCAEGIWAAGGPVLDGNQWDAYRCGHSLGAGDYDVVKRYGMITARRSYICPQDQLGDGRCSTIYDGQDKR